MAIDSPTGDEAPLDWTFGEPLTPLPARRGGRGGPDATSTLTGGVLIVLAAFLPWATATDGETVPGTNTVDGPLMLVLGVIIASAGIGRLSARMPPGSRSRRSWWPGSPGGPPGLTWASPRPTPLRRAPRTRPCPWVPGCTWSSSARCSPSVDVSRSLGKSTLGSVPKKP